MKNQRISMSILLGIAAFVIVLGVLIKLAFVPFLFYAYGELEREFAEWDERRENGEIVPGKDTRLIWENKYQIIKYPSWLTLLIYEEPNGLTDSVLQNITDYKTKGEKLYVVSEEGYAVIDKDSFCRVCITVPADEFINGYIVAKDGSKFSHSGFLEYDNILYLSKFEDFTEDERKILNKMR